jgi:phage gp45-like
MQWEHDDGMRVTTRRARIDKVNDKGSQQLVDFRGLKNEKPQKVWRPQDFGYTSVPPKDCDGVMIQMGSRADRTLYLDGGHQKYRPKNTPDGCTALFNMHGDIIRVFKDNADVVHQSKINIRIGHGYAAGQSGDSSASGSGIGGAEGDQIDDTSDQDEKTISIVMDGDAVVITYQQGSVRLDDSQVIATYDDSSVKLESGKITHTSPHVVIKSERVDLGDEGGTLIGLCSGGCATKVYAV